MQHVNGIDVSGFQDPCDFALIRAAGYSYAWSKATQGTGFFESTYATKRASAKANGVLYGAYHFMDWDADATEQAVWFLRNAAPATGDLVPALDCEWPDSVDPAVGVQKMSAWLSYVGRAVGRFPVVYLSPAFWSGPLGSTSGFTGHPLWLAEYDVDAPATLGAWKPTFWQRSENGTVDGIAGSVDLDWFLGAASDLDAFRLR